MARATLQECISLFENNHTYMPVAVRNMEQLGEYRTAAKYWRKLKNTWGYSGNSEMWETNAKACEMIAEAIEKGDAYRADVKPLHDWVDETVEKGFMTKEEAIKVIYPQMNEIYNRHFRVSVTNPVLNSNY